MLFRKNICTHVFFTAFFTIAKIWKQPKCPSVDEWIKKLWYIYTVEYFKAIHKKEGTLTFCDSVDTHGEYNAK